MENAVDIDVVVDHLLNGDQKDLGCGCDFDFEWNIEIRLNLMIVDAKRMKKQVDLMFHCHRVIDCAYQWCV